MAHVNNTNNVDNKSTNSVQPTQVDIKELQEKVKAFAAKIVDKALQAEMTRKTTTPETKPEASTEAEVEAQVKDDILEGFGFQKSDGNKSTGTLKRLDVDPEMIKKVKEFEANQKNSLESCIKLEKMNVDPKVIKELTELLADKKNHEIIKKIIKDTKNAGEEVDIEKIKQAVNAENKKPYITPETASVEIRTE